MGVPSLHSTFDGSSSTLLLAERPASASRGAQSLQTRLDAVEDGALWPQARLLPPPPLWRLFMDHLQSSLHLTPLGPRCTMLPHQHLTLPRALPVPPLRFLQCQQRRRVRQQAELSAATRMPAAPTKTQVCGTCQLDCCVRLARSAHDVRVTIQEDDTRRKHASGEYHYYLPPSSSPPQVTSSRTAPLHECMLLLEDARQSFLARLVLALPAA